MKRKLAYLLGTLSLALLTGMAGWHAGSSPGGLHGHSGSHGGHGAHAMKRPSNQTAVVTIWSPAELIETTGQFYAEVLGLERIGDSTEPFVVNTDGTFLIVMLGELKHPSDTKRRWPSSP